MYFSPVYVLSSESKEKVNKIQRKFVNFDPVFCGPRGRQVGRLIVSNNHWCNAWLQLVSSPIGIDQK